MLNAIGAWLHCRQADLHKDGATGQYSSAETPHELSEEEIRLVIERMSNCKVLFPADQAYVSWEVRQHFLVGIHLALVDAVLRLHLRVYAPHVRVVVLTSDVQGVEQFCRQLSGSTVHCTAFG